MTQYGMTQYQLLSRRTVTCDVVRSPGNPSDLEKRTAWLGEAVIDFAETVPVNPVTSRLISQLVGASTSAGANYCEADDAVSGKDFRHEISSFVI